MAGLPLVVYPYNPLLKTGRNGIALVPAFNETVTRVPRPARDKLRESLVGAGFNPARSLISLLLFRPDGFSQSFQPVRFAGTMHKSESGRVFLQ